MIKYLLSSCICLCSLYLQGQRIVLDHADSIYIVNEQIQFFEETNANNGLDIAQISAFPFEPKENIEFKPNQVYWGTFDLEIDLPKEMEEREWVLEFSLLHTHLDLYVLYPNQEFKSYKTGFFVPVSDRSFMPVIKGNVVKIALDNEEGAKLFFKSRCDRMLAIPDFEIRISSFTNYSASLIQQRQHQGIFIGFVLMMLIYNIFLFFYSLKDKAYIYYSLYLLGLLVYNVFNTGTLANWLTPRLFPDYPFLIYYGKISVYAVIFSYPLFLRSFLDLKSILPRWDTILKWMAYISIFLACVDIFLLWYSNYSYDIPDTVTVFSSLAFLLTSFIFAFYLFRTKDKKGYFIVIGILVMGTGALITTIGRMQTINFGTYFFKVGIILELIVFSLGLAYRKRDIERAKQASDFELEKAQLRKEQREMEARRLKELDDLKTNLYTNITHEFRTPLTVIMGITENIKGHENEKILISRNSHQLLNLINQMLDLAKIESNNLQLEFEPQEAISYLKYLFESFDSLARAKNIALVFEANEDVLWIHSDEQKLQRLVSNLISNAIKFTPEKGTIYFVVDTEKQDEQLYLNLTVKDTGIGIAEHELGHLFDRFYQTPNSQSGTGIGLALVKEIVDLWKGEISVDSRLDHGTSFNIRLPVQEISEQAVIIDEVYGEEEQTNTPMLIDPIEKPLLLLVEDSPDVAIYLQQILLDKYQFHLAENGKIGFDRASEIVPDIIISDVMMPEMDGFELTTKLKKSDKTSHIPIILLTAKASDADRLKGIKVGADAFLLKPFNKKELFLRLEQLYVIRQMLKEKFSLNPPLANEVKEVEKEVEKEVSLEEQFILKLKTKVYQHLDDLELSIEDLCEETSMSHNQLYRKLKALTGLSPIVFIRKIRLAKAVEMLESTDLNISEIAYRVGFKDPNYFTRVFQQEYNKAPREFLSSR